MYTSNENLHLPQTLDNFSLGKDTGTNCKYDVGSGSPTWGSRGSYVMAGWRLHGFDQGAKLN